MRRRPFQIVCADPPWTFGDKLPGNGRGAEKHYKVLTVEDIERFPLPPIADDALLFLWRVSSQQEEALRVARAWGFEPKSEIVWVKLAKRMADSRYPNETVDWRSGDGLHFGMGRYLRLAHESCVVATRGRGKDLVADRATRSVFFAPTGRHSEKPEAFFELVEKLVGPEIRKVDLFARRRRRGWTCLGDEV